MKTILVVTIFSVSGGWIDVKASKTSSQVLPTEQACEAKRRETVTSLQKDRAAQFIAICRAA